MSAAWRLWNKRLSGEARLRPNSDCTTSTVNFVAFVNTRSAALANSLAGQPPRTRVLLNEFVTVLPMSLTTLVMSSVTLPSLV
jgi:hypothetical protein